MIPNMPGVDGVREERIVGAPIAPFQIALPDAVSKKQAIGERDYFAILAQRRAAFEERFGYTPEMLNQMKAANPMMVPGEERILPTGEVLFVETVTAAGSDRIERGEMGQAIREVASLVPRQDLRVRDAFPEFEMWWPGKEEGLPQPDFDSDETICPGAIIGAGSTPGEA